MTAVFSSGNNGRIEFERDPLDEAEPLDLTLNFNNVVFWRFDENRVKFVSVTPHPKVISNPGDEFLAPGRRTWECLVRFLLRTSIFPGELSNRPARFKLWSTVDGGFGRNWRQGFGYAGNITTVGDRRGAVIAEARMRAAWGGLTRATEA